MDQEMETRKKEMGKYQTVHLMKRRNDFRLREIRG